MCLFNIWENKYSTQEALMYDKVLTTKWFYLRRLERSLALRLKSLNEVIIVIFIDYLQKKLKVWNPNIFLRNPGLKSVPNTMTLFSTNQHNNCFDKMATGGLSIV